MAIDHNFIRKIDFCKVSGLELPSPGHYDSRLNLPMTVTVTVDLYDSEVSNNQIIKYAIAINIH